MAHLMVLELSTGSSYSSISGWNCGDCLSFSKLGSSLIFWNPSKPESRAVFSASRPGSTYRHPVLSLCWLPSWDTGQLQDCCSAPRP